MALELRLVIILSKKLIVMSIIDDMESVRKAGHLNQDQLAAAAGIARMTVNNIATGKVDPRLSTVEALARALGLELMVVPKEMRSTLESFVRSGGRVLGQPTGASAPPSVVDQVLGRS